MLRISLTVVLAAAALSGCGQPGAPAVAGAGRPAAVRALSAPELFREVLAGVDRDRNGAVEAVEARGTWLEGDFTQMDSTRDGHLTAPELDRFLTTRQQAQRPEGIAGAIGIGTGVAGTALAAYLAYAGMVGSSDMMYPDPAKTRKDPQAYGIAFEAVRFKSHDGLSLAGWYVPAKTKTDKGLVVFHGHGSNKDNAFKKYGHWLHEKYNLFLYDSRYMGESEGAFSTLGFLERHDAIKAIDELRRRGSSRIGLMGESMGGAVAINAGAMVKDVKAVLNDSAFDSLEDAIAPRAAARKYPLPDLVAKAVVATATMRTRGNLVEAEPIRWVDKLSPKPFFVIHGLKDDETLPLNGEKLFAKAKEPKQAWWPAEAQHTNAYKIYPEEYRKRVFTFFDQAL